jgi:hypothetical protein
MEAWENFRSVWLLGLALLCWGAAITSLRGAFSSRQTLLSMSKLIGTTNPVGARVVCFVGLVVFTGVTALLVLLVVHSVVWMVFILIVSFGAYCLSWALRRAYAGSTRSNTVNRAEPQDQGYSE